MTSIVLPLSMTFACLQLLANVLSSMRDICLGD